MGTLWLCRTSDLDYCRIQVVKYHPPPPKHPLFVGISGRCVDTTGCEEVARASFHLVLDTHSTISPLGGQPPSKGSKWHT